MPFDDKGTITLTRLQKLERLLKLSFESKSQADFCTCLYHQAVNDPVFIAAGLQVSEDARGNDSTTAIATMALEAADAFFGVTFGSLWGTSSILHKRAEICALIAEEKAR